jgi:hypothetical protein
VATADRTAYPGRPWGTRPSIVGHSQGRGKGGVEPPRLPWPRIYAGALVHGARWELSLLLSVYWPHLENSMPPVSRGEKLCGSLCG